jgi:hypothetical protein
MLMLVHFLSEAYGYLKYARFQRACSRELEVFVSLEAFGACKGWKRQARYTLLTIEQDGWKCFFDGYMRTKGKK